MKAVLAVGVTLAVLALGGCGGDSSGTVAREWLPKLESENAKMCQKDDCSAEVTERQLALTAELADDARKGGEKYAAVAAMAERVRLAHKYWEQDCYPGGDYSANAGMSCSEALSLSINGTNDLETLLRQVAVSEQ